MNYKNYLYLTVSSLLAGMLLMSLQKKWIILNFKPSYLEQTLPKANFHKKMVSLFCWKNQTWSCEKNEILWCPDQASNLNNLIQAWLVLLEEEKITPVKINLQAAMVNANQQTAYISFDQSLFSKDASTYQKLMTIEALLKTLRENGINIPNIQFLTQHKHSKDGHLDFSNPWPLIGFLK